MPAPTTYQYNLHPEPTPQEKENPFVQIKKSMQYFSMRKGISHNETHSIFKIIKKKHVLKKFVSSHTKRPIHGTIDVLFRF